MILRWFPSISRFSTLQDWNIFMRIDYNECGWDCHARLARIANYLHDIEWCEVWWEAEFDTVLRIRSRLEPFYFSLPDPAYKKPAKNHRKNNILQKFYYLSLSLYRTYIKNVIRNLFSFVLIFSIFLVTRKKSYKKL